MSEPVIAGIQQVGVGVANAAEAFAWYRRHFGFDVRIFDDEAEAPLMRGYTGGVVQRRRAILAINMAGGGGLEIWQFLSRAPAAPAAVVALGHRGLFAARLKTPDVAAIAEKAHRTLDVTDRFGDLQAVPGGTDAVRRVRLVRSTPPGGPFSALLGAAQVDLVQPVHRSLPRIYDGRFWGDPGFIHVCFDVRGTDAIHARASAAGRHATVDSAGSFDMGEAAGRFSYVEDPDGTLVELVETHKVPVLKKLGWYIDLRKRPPDRVLPRWMVRSLAFNRVRD